MNIINFGQIAISLIIVFVGVKIIKSVFKVNVKLAENGSPLYMSLGNSMMSSFGILLGGLFIISGIGMTAMISKDSYENIKAKQILKEEVVATVKYRKEEYERISKKLPSLSQKEKRQVEPILAKVKEEAEMDVNKEFEVIDEHTAESYRKHRMKLGELEREPTLSYLIEVFSVLY